MKMKTGRIALLDKPLGKFTVEELPVPEPRRGELLVRQVMCGVCGTDVHVYQGHLPGVKYPIVLGHEPVGTVEKLGEGVETDYTGRPVEEGDLIYVLPGLRCRKCYFCAVLMEPTLCLDSKGYGFNPFPEEPRSFHGGYADYLYVNHPRSMFLKMEAKPEAAVLLEPLSVGMHTADRIQLRAGSTVVIQGAGAIGISALVIAKLTGALKAIVVGAPESRLRMAEEFGADMTIDIEKVKDPKERIDMVKGETMGGYGADAVIECTGVPVAVPEGIKMLRRNGTYAVVGHYTDTGATSLNPFTDFCNKQITLVGVWGADITHFVRGRPIIESGRHPFEKFVSHKLPLERCEDAMKALMGGYRLDGREVKKIVVAGGI